MIHFNNPEYAKERQNVKPLTLEQEKNIVAHLNLYFSDMPIMQKKLQRLIWNYENLRARHDMDVKTKGDLWETKEK